MRSVLKTTYPLGHSRYEGAPAVPAIVKPEVKTIEEPIVDEPVVDLSKPASAAPKKDSNTAEGGGKLESE